MSTANNSRLRAVRNTLTTTISHFIDGMNALCSTPLFSITPERVIMTLTYYADTPLPSSAFNVLSTALNTLFPHIQVELIVAYTSSPLMSSMVLAQYLAINASRYGFNAMVNSIDNVMSMMHGSNITGMKIVVSGLLSTQMAAPGQTQKTYLFGTLSNNADYAQFTSKSTMGAYTVKVWISTRA